MFNVLLIIITATMVIYFVWNFLNNQSNPHQRNTDDIRYFELKSKYEFLVSAVTLFTVVFVYLGISTKENLENEFREKLNNELKPSIDSIKNAKIEYEIFKTEVNKEISTYKDVISGSVQKINDMSSTQNEIYKRSLQSSKGLKMAENKINTISNMNILKKEFYIIDNLKISNSVFSKGMTEKIFFKDLITTSGDKLPQFEYEPVVIVSNLDGGQMGSTKITKEYVEVIVSAIFNGDENKPIMRYKLVIYY